MKIKKSSNNPKEAMFNFNQPIQSLKINFLQPIEPNPVSSEKQSTKPKSKKYFKSFGDGLSFINNIQETEKSESKILLKFRQTSR